MRYSDDHVRSCEICDGHVRYIDDLVRSCDIAMVM